MSDSGGPQKTKKAKKQSVGGTPSKSGGKKARESEELPLYKADDDVWVWYGDNRFPAKIIKVIDEAEQVAERRTYLIHYKNWNKRHDNVVPFSKIIGYQSDVDLSESIRGPPKKSMAAGWQQGAKKRESFGAQGSLKRPRNRTSSCSSSNAGDATSKQAPPGDKKKEKDDKKGEKKQQQPRKKKEKVEEGKEEVKVEQREKKGKESPVKQNPNNKQPRQRRTKKQMQEAQQEKEKMMKEQQVKEEVKVEVHGEQEKVGGAEPLVKKEIVKVKVENHNSTTFQSKFVFVNIQNI